MQAIDTYIQGMIRNWYLICYDKERNLQYGEKLGKLGEMSDDKTEKSGPMTSWWLQRKKWVGSRLAMVYDMQYNMREVLILIFKKRRFELEPVPDPLLMSHEHQGTKLDPIPFSKPLNQFLES